MVGGEPEASQANRGPAPKVRDTFYCFRGPVEREHEHRRVARLLLGLLETMLELPADDGSGQLRKLRLDVAAGARCLHKTKQRFLAGELALWLEDKSADFVGRLVTLIISLKLDLDIDLTKTILAHVSRQLENPECRMDPLLPNLSHLLEEILKSPSSGLDWDRPSKQVRLSNLLNRIEPLELENEALIRQLIECESTLLVQSDQTIRLKMVEIFIQTLKSPLREEETFGALLSFADKLINSRTSKPDQETELDMFTSLLCHLLSQPSELCERFYSSARLARMFDLCFELNHEKAGLINVWLMNMLARWPQTHSDAQRALLRKKFMRFTLDKLIEEAAGVQDPANILPDLLFAIVAALNLDRASLGQLLEGVGLLESDFLRTYLGAWSKSILNRAGGRHWSPEGCYMSYHTISRRALRAIIGDANGCLYSKFDASLQLRIDELAELIFIYKWPYNLVGTSPLANSNEQILLDSLDWSLPQGHSSDECLATQTQPGST